MKKINRRDAIKYAGTATIATIGAVAGIGGLQSCNDNSENNSNSTILSTKLNSSDMKILLVNGSPHQQGCTYTALTEIATSLANNGVKSEIFWLGTDAISGCLGCQSCRKTGKCVIADKVNEFSEQAKTADGFVFGSPVHYAGASGFITPFLDRVFYSAGSNLVCKPAAAIVSCRRAGSTAALDQLNKYITINSMPMVTSQYWNMVHGNTPDQVRQDLEGMQIMRTLGVNMAWLLKSIEAGQKAGVPAPKYEERIGTNFIRS